MFLFTWLWRLQKLAVIVGILYLGLLALCCIPFFQRHLLYMHSLRLPFAAKYDSPVTYGLSPNKTLNVHIPTSDSSWIGAWFILSDGYYKSLPGIPANVSGHLEPALAARPTILFLHGNAATRAVAYRIDTYSALSSRLDANILAIDYRGFGESPGVPSEPGLVHDAHAAFRWIAQNGGRSEDVLVMGHSLGTGVSAQLAARLGDAGIQYRGLVLLAPFTSLMHLLETYHVFGFIPILKPLYAVLPQAAKFVKMAFEPRFDTLEVTARIAAPKVLLAHAVDDWSIPHSHSDILFDTFLGLHDAYRRTPWRERSSSEAEALDDQRRKFVKSTVIPRFGRVDEAIIEGREVTLVKTLNGGHNSVVFQEGLQDIIRRKFGF